MTLTGIKFGRQRADGLSTTRAVLLEYKLADGKTVEKRTSLYRLVYHPGRYGWEVESRPYGEHRPGRWTPIGGVDLTPDQARKVIIEAIQENRAG